MTTPYMRSQILSIAAAIRHRESSGQDGIINVRPQVARSYIAIKRATNVIDMYFSDQLRFGEQYIAVWTLKQRGRPKFEYTDPEMCDQISQFMAKEYGAFGLAWPEDPSINGL